MEEMPQANERLNKRCLGGNPRYNLLLYFNFPQFSIFKFSLEKKINNKSTTLFKGRLRKVIFEKKG
jgi:hypothetical protein